MKNYWYKEKIEEPLREIIRYLRNNGVNTECSCGHEMYIQCQYRIDGHVQEIHNLVWNYLNSKRLNVDFEISIIHKVIDGKSYTSLNIEFPDTEEVRNKL